MCSDKLTNRSYGTCISAHGQTWVGDGSLQHGRYKLKEVHFVVSWWWLQGEERCLARLGGRGTERGTPPITRSELQDEQHELNASAVYVYVCVYVCACVSGCMCTCVHVCECVSVCMYVFVCTCMFRVYMYMCACTCVWGEHKGTTKKDVVFMEKRSQYLLTLSTVIHYGLMKFGI